MENVKDTEQGCSTSSDDKKECTGPCSSESNDENTLENIEEYKRTTFLKSSKTKQEPSNYQCLKERDYKVLLELAWGFIPKIERSAEVTAVNTLDIFMNAIEGIYGFKKKERKRYLRLLEDEIISDLAPYFTNLIKEAIQRSLKSFNLSFLNYTMKMIQSLLKNKSINLSKHFNIIVPAVVCCGVAEKVCKTYKKNHWSMRELCAIIAAEILNKHSNDVKMAKSVIKLYLKVVKSADEYNFPSIYGAVKGLTSLGPRVIRDLLIPNIQKISSKILKAENPYDPYSKKSVKVLTEAKYVRELITQVVVPVVQEHIIENDFPKYIEKFGYIGSYIYDEINSSSILQETTKSEVYTDSGVLSSAKSTSVTKSKAKTYEKLPLAPVHSNIYSSPDNKSQSTHISFIDKPIAMSSSVKGKSLLKGKSYKKTSEPKKINQNVSDSQIYSTSEVKRPKMEDGQQEFFSPECQTTNKSIELEDGQQEFFSPECQTTNKSIELEDGQQEFFSPECQTTYKSIEQFSSSEHTSQHSYVSLESDTSNYIEQTPSYVGSDLHSDTTPINSEGWSSPSSIYHSHDTEGIDHLYSENTPINSEGWSSNSSNYIPLNTKGIDHLMGIYSANDTTDTSPLLNTEQNSSHYDPMLPNINAPDPCIQTSLFSFKEDDYLRSELNSQTFAGPLTPIRTIDSGILPLDDVDYNEEDTKENTDIMKK